jgi:uncharacterized protein (TIGR02246 family)
MRTLLILAGLAFGLLAVLLVERSATGGPAAGQGPSTVNQATVPPGKADATASGAAATADATPEQARTEDEKAVRLAAETFARAYNAHDAKAIAAQFMVDGQIVDDEGQATQGRQGIEALFAQEFKDHPKTHVELATASIHCIGPDLAIENGISTITEAPDAPAQRNPYTVTYSKHEGKWLTASARDFSEESPTPEQELKKLAWLIGDWVDESPEALVMTDYHWSENQCYLLGHFKVQIAGRPVMTGTHRIGWDPVAKHIRSWVFDSEGGFAEGVWTPEGNQWVVKMTGVTRDGKIASSTNITTHVSKHRMTWQSHDRIVGGEKKPDMPEIVITRSPPQPKPLHAAARNKP